MRLSRPVLPAFPAETSSWAPRPGTQRHHRSTASRDRIAEQARTDQRHVPVPWVMNRRDSLKLALTSVEMNLSPETESRPPRHCLRGVIAEHPSACARC
jgi:hypothetical protein